MEDKLPHTPSLLNPRTRRYAWIILLGALLGSVWGYLGVLRKPVSYSSESRMFVSGRVNVPDASSAYSEEVANYLGTQSEIMRSQEVQSRARQRVLLEQPGVAGTASILIRVLPGTTVFNLTAQGNNGPYCRAFLDAVMTEFIQFKRERRMVTSQTTIEQISAEILRLEKEIDTQEQQLLRFKEQNNVSYWEQNNVSYWEQQSVSSARFLSDLKARESTLRMQMTVMDSWEKAASQLDLADRAEIGESGAVVFTGADNENRRKLQAATVERDQLLQGLRPVHPKIVQLNATISRLKKLIELDSANQAERRKERRSAMQAELDGLARSIAEWEAKSLESSRYEGEYQKIRGTLDRTRELYGRMVASLQTIDTRKGVDQELVQILQYATVAAPVDPGMRRIVFSGAFGGLCIGTVLFMIACRIDENSFSVDEAVDRIGVRSFAEVPQLPSGPVSADRRKLIESSFEESFRRMRSLISIGIPASPTPVYLITSALPSEGKSEIAINLARTFARSGRRVLLIDADLRRGRIHKTFQVGESSPGLCELLMGEADSQEVLRPTAEPNLTLIPAGNSTTHVNEILSTRDFAGRIEALRKLFDVIILDTAPIGLVDDTGHLIPLASRILFVIRMRKTPIRQAVKAVNNLRVRGATDFGLVLNCVKQGNDRYYYSYHK